MAAVEFAFTLPIYLVSIILLVEVARLVYTQSVVLYAAEEATRYALVNYDATSSDIQTVASDKLLGLDPNNLTAIIVTSPVDPDDHTKLVTVEVRYQYVPLLPIDKLIPLGDADGYALKGQSKGFLTEEIPY